MIWLCSPIILLPRSRKSSGSTIRHCAAIERDFEKISAEIEQRHAAAKEQIVRVYHEQVAQLKAKYGEQFNTLGSSDRSTRQRIVHDFERIEHDVKSKLQQAVWLADSVLEATQNQMRVEAKKSKEKYDSRIEELDAFNTQAKQRWRTTTRSHRPCR